MLENIGVCSSMDDAVRWLIGECGFDKGLVESSNNLKVGYSSNLVPESVVMQVEDVNDVELVPSTFFKIAEKRSPKIDAKFKGIDSSTDAVFKGTDAGLKYTDAGEECNRVEFQDEFTKSFNTGVEITAGGERAMTHEEKMGFILNNVKINLYSHSEFVHDLKACVDYSDNGNCMGCRVWGH